MSRTARRPLIAGNWKMHKTIEESLELVRALVALSLPDSVDVAVCPPFTALAAVAEELGDELLRQTFRHRVDLENRQLLEDVASRALGAAAGPPAEAAGDAGGSLDDFLAGGDGAFDDPLGIAMSWEEKYAKKGEAGGTQA